MQLLLTYDETDDLWPIHTYDVDETKLNSAVELRLVSIIDVNWPL